METLTKVLTGLGADSPAGAILLGLIFFLSSQGGVLFFYFNKPMLGVTSIALAVTLAFLFNWVLARRRLRLERLRLEQKAREVEADFETARGQDKFATYESRKDAIDDSLFIRNRRSEFRARRLEIEGASFFSDCNWELSSNFNVLLGKNGYGKSYLLHAIAALLAADYKAMAEMFPSNETEQRLGLTVDYRRDVLLEATERSPIGSEAVRNTQVLFQTSGLKIRQVGALRSRLGPVPILAIPDLRFIDQSSLAFGIGSGEFNDVVRSGAVHFLKNQPIVGLVHAMLYQLCLDYLELGNLKLPGIELLERVVTKLSGARFEIKDIRRSRSTPTFEIDVVAEDNRVMPLQRASQGTLSTVAMFGLIERFLRALDLNTRATANVCRRAAIVIIDELDAHLHPAWQRQVVSLLRETFPNVQFIVSAHSPLIVAECLESEVAVLRKRRGKFAVEPDPLLIEQDIAGVLRWVFETDPESGTISKYVALLGNRDKLRATIDKFRDKDELTDTDESEIARAETELDRLDRAERAHKQQMRIEDVEEYETALKERVTQLEAQVAALEKKAKNRGDLA